MSAARSTAGFSMVEMLVVLALVASLAAVAAMSLRPEAAAPRTGDLLQLFAEARAASILTGEPAVISIAEGTATFGGKNVQWAGHLRVNGTGVSMPHQILAYPDGSYSGSRLAIENDGVTTTVDGIYREGTR